MNKIILLAACGLLCSTFTQAKIKDNLCISGETTVGFFNGVWNSEQDAENSLHKIAESFFSAESENGEEYEFEVFYNRTQSKVADLYETFTQRLFELYDIDLRNHWEIYWESINGNTSSSPTIPSSSETIANSDAWVAKSFEEWREEVYRLAGLSQRPETLADMAAHATRVKTLLLEKKQLLLIAHSQGNLFVNRAYETALAQADGNSVKVIHIAPASVQLKGPYVLASKDMVINMLRLVESNYGPVPPSNFTLEWSDLKRDFSGHELMATYLEPQVASYNMLAEHIQTAIDNLTPPESDANQGFFTVTLTWNGLSDIDLNIVEPDGNHVYYHRLIGHSGEMDLDNTEGYGPEHYYASCDADKLQTGLFHIYIYNEDSGEGQTATVQIASVDDGVLLSKSVTFVDPYEEDDDNDEACDPDYGCDYEPGPEEKKTVDIAKVLISKNEEGKFIARIN